MMYNVHSIRLFFTRQRKRFQVLEFPHKLATLGGLFFADGMATPTLAGGVFTILIPHYMTEKLVQRYIRVAHFSVILAGDAVRGLPLYKPGICLQGGHAHCDTRHDMRPDR